MWKQIWLRSSLVYMWDDIILPPREISYTNGHMNHCAFPNMRVGPPWGLCQLVAIVFDLVGAWTSLFWQRMIEVPAKLNEFENYYDGRVLRSLFIIAGRSRVYGYSKIEYTAVVRLALNGNIPSRTKFHYLHPLRKQSVIECHTPTSNLSDSRFVFLCILLTKEQDEWMPVSLLSHLM